MQGTVTPVQEKHRRKESAKAREITTSDLGDLRDFEERDSPGGDVSPVILNARSLATSQGNRK